MPQWAHCAARLKPQDRAPTLRAAGAGGTLSREDVTEREAELEQGTGGTENARRCVPGIRFVRPASGKRKQDAAARRIRLGM